MTPMQRNMVMANLFILTQCMMHCATFKVVGQFGIEHIFENLNAIEKEDGSGYNYNLIDAHGNRSYFDLRTSVVYTI
jgi:hypothetical protein